MIISEEIKSKIAEIGKKRGLALVVLFGSQARGDAYKNSDIDIAYSSIQPIDLSEESEMAAEFHKIFKTSNVDLVNLSHASPLLLRFITKDGIALYEAKNSIFNELYLYAQKIYNESEHLNALRRDYVLNRISKYKTDIIYAR